MRNKLGPRKIHGIKHPVFLSNYGPDVTTLFQIFYAKEYEVPFDIAPTTIIDCGANIGLSAVFYANVFPQAKIIAIEPDKNNFYFLEKNTAQYGNIICLNKAVWSHTTKLDIVDEGGGNWALKTKVASDSLTVVESISILQIMDEFDMNTIDVLKIDIEGAEKELFSVNFEGWLSKTKLIAIELHENIDKDIPMIFFKALDGRSYQKYFNGENLICRFS